MKQKLNNFYNCNNLNNQVQVLEAITWS